MSSDTKRVSMQQESTLTAAQINWVRDLVRVILPFVPQNYHFKTFMPYLHRRAIGNLKFTPPSPLQFPINSLNPEMEFDIPEMLVHEPFINLFNRLYLADLQAESKKGGNTFEYLVRRKYENNIRLEEKEFSKLSKNSIDVDIPDLFLRNFDNKNILGEYNSNRDIFTFDFSHFLNNHSPTDIIVAYQYFARRIYALLIFSIWREIPSRDLETMKKYFSYFLEEILEEKLPFYGKLLDTKTDFGKMEDNKNWDLLKKIEERQDLLFEYEMVANEALEAKKNSEEIYEPISIENLITIIMKKITKNTLKGEKSKRDNYYITEKDIKFIKEMFYAIGTAPSLISLNLDLRLMLETEFELSKQKKGSWPHKLFIIEQIFEKDKIFFNNLIATNIFLQKKVHRLPRIFRIMPSSFDEPVEIKDPSGVIKATLVSVTEDKKGKITHHQDQTGEKIILETTKKIICFCIKKHFREEINKKFADDFIIYIKNYSETDLEEKLDKIFSNYYLTDRSGEKDDTISQFDYYEKLRGIQFLPALREHEKKIFRKKMLELKRDITERLNKWNMN